MRKFPLATALLCITLAVAGASQAADGRGLALCVGVNGYYNMGKLKYSANDAVAIKNVLESSGDYSNILLLTDKPENEESQDPRFWPLQSNILQALQQISTSAGPDDRLLFFFSGHGVQRDGKHFLVPLEGREDNAIAMDDIKSIISASRAGSKLLLVDACRSGGGMKGVPGIRGSVENIGIGMIVSCAEDQFSYEDDNYKRSVFSLMLEEALMGRGDLDSDNSLTGDEVHQYLTKRMNEYCLENGIFTSQTPQVNKDGRKVEVMRISPAMAEDSQSPKWKVKDLIADGVKLMQSDDPDLDGPEAMAKFEEVIAMKKIPPEEHAKALYLLGRCHADGLGVYPDHLYAVECWEEAAELGNADAQFALAHTYFEGIEVYPDYEEAYRWAEMAAEKDNPDAQVMMGRILYKGKDGEPDYREATKWFRKASSSGSTEGKYWLGLTFREGNGVKQNARQAVKWFTEAAKEDHAESQIALGEMFMTGEGVKKDAKQGMKWLSRAAENGGPASQYTLGMLYYEGRSGVAKDLAEAVEWLEKAADGDDARAIAKLAEMYEYGHGVERDMDKAAEYLKMAADRGDATAQLRLGNLYYYGEGVDRDIPRAVSFLRSAANDNPDAQALLGKLYYEGKEVPQNYQEAGKWLRRAAEDGNTESKILLGTMYAEGLGVKQDPAEALKWLRDGDESDPELCYVLGRLYLGEIGGKHDKMSDKEAARWFRRAAESDHVDAQNKLAQLLYDSADAKTTDAVAPAIEWWTKAAENGSVGAQMRLGDLYSRENDAGGVATDFEEAAKWYRLAAKQGETEALTRLGSLHQDHGNSSPDNIAMTKQWFSLAAAKGDSKARRNFENMFPGESYDDVAAKAEGAFDAALDSFFGKKNPALEKALSLYEKKEYSAAKEIYSPLSDKGDVAAQYNMGELYYSGHGVGASREQAYSLWRKAADQGSADAQVKVGLCYIDGVGVQLDYAEAAKWLRKAAEQGHPEALHQLGHLYYDGRGVVLNTTEGARLFEAAKARGIECTTMESALTMAKYMATSGQSTAKKEFDITDVEAPLYAQYLIKDGVLGSHSPAAAAAATAPAAVVQAQPVYQQQQQQQQQQYRQPSRRSGAQEMMEAANIMGGFIRAFR